MRKFGAEPRLPMIKSLMREITLAIQAKNGASVAVVVWLGVVGVGAADRFRLSLRRRL